MLDLNFRFRFDCQPEKKVAVTQQKCIARGCVWDETNIPGVPSCYYPSDFKSYKKDSAPVETDEGLCS